MKGIIALAVICLLACSVESTGSKKLSNNRHAYLSHSQRERDNESCTLSCTSGSHSVDSSKNWMIQLEGSAHIFIVYSNDNNYFGIYNKNLGIAIIFYDGVYGLFNVSKGSGIIVNMSTDVGYYIEGSGALSDFDDDYMVYDGFDVLWQTVKDNQAKVTGNVDVNSGNCFNMQKLIVAISVSIDIKAADIFKARQELAASISASFNVIINLVHERCADETISVGVGIIAVVAPILNVVGKTATTVRSIFEFIVAVKVNLAGKITAALFEVIYQALTTVSGTVEAAVSAVTKAISAVGTLYTNISDALTAVKNKVVADVKISYVTVKNITYRITHWATEERSWTFEVRGTGSNSSESYVISFSASSNYLVVFNKSTGFAFVFVGSNAYYGVYNCRKGVGIAVQHLLGYGIYVTQNSVIISGYFIEGSEDYVNGFKAIAGVISSTHISISDITKGNIFNYNGVINAVGQGKSYDNYFIGKGQLKAAIQANFSVFFDAYAKLEKKKSEGALGCVRVLLVGLDVENLVQGFVSLIVNIQTKLGGYFNTQLLNNTYSRITVGIQISFKVDVFASLNSALSSIKGTITSFSSAVSAITKVSSSASVSGNVTISHST